MWPWRICSNTVVLHHFRYTGMTTVHGGTCYHVPCSRNARPAWHGTCRWCRMGRRRTHLGAPGSTHKGTPGQGVHSYRHCALVRVGRTVHRRARRMTFAARHGTTQLAARTCEECRARCSGKRGSELGGLLVPVLRYRPQGHPFRPRGTPQTSRCHPVGPGAYGRLTAE